MSTKPNAFPVKILELIRESVRSMQRNTKALINVVLFLVGGFLAADVLAFVLQRMIWSRSLFEIVKIIQSLIKVVIMFSAVWTAIYLMKFLSAGSEPQSIGDWWRKLKNMLPRILATFVSVAIRFLVPGMLIVGGTFLAVMAKSRAILLLSELVFGILVSYLFVQYVFAIYLIFEPGLKPWDIPSRSSELMDGYGWKIFFIMFACGILASIAFTPLFLLYPGILKKENILAISNLAIDVFSHPSIFVLLCYIIIALAVVFQATVFMKFYDKITGTDKS